MRKIADAHVGTDYSSMSPLLTDAGGEQNYLIVNSVNGSIVEEILYIHGILKRINQIFV